MKCPPILPNEAERLRALAEYGLDEQQGLPSLDPVVRIAAHMFGMPVAAVNMIGADHVFFAAATGIGEVDMGRDVSFCAHAITRDQVMIVRDATQDERFSDNPLVVGKANVRFYAGVPLYSPDGLPLGALCVLDDHPHPEFTAEHGERLRELARMATDRLELRRIEARAERTRPAFADYASHSPTAVIWFDERGGLLEWNRAAARLWGYDESERPPLAALLAENQRPWLADLLAAARVEGNLSGITLPDELWGSRRDGRLFPVAWSLFSWRDNGTLRFEAMVQDLSARHRQDEELRKLAHTDALTGLANRSAFFAHVEAILARPEAVAVLLIDLDGFKDINDTLGHAIGDEILREVAVRLAPLTVQPRDLARIGGDEFALLVVGGEVGEKAAALAAQVREAIGRPLQIRGQTVRLHASCGLAMAPQHANEALELLADADLALFKAKSSGKNSCFSFQPALRMEAIARHLYGIELNRAVGNGEFLLFYQPQVRLSDGRLKGAEALLRWHHPERGLLSPAAFLPALESGPLARAVGSWVLEEACAQAAYWQRHGARDFRMGINLSAAQFRVDDLVSEVVAALSRHGLSPQSIELEITENIAIENDERVLSAMRALRALGVGVAFDDFGTGYASLSLLKTYPLSRIKIDKSFVQGMLESRRDASVIRAILDMARGFDLETITEGIETEEQRQRLIAEGCAEGQGYLFGPPMPATQFGRLFGIGDLVSRAG